MLFVVVDVVVVAVVLVSGADMAESATFLESVYSGVDDGDGDADGDGGCIEAKAGRRDRGVALGDYTGTYSRCVCVCVC